MDGVRFHRISRSPPARGREGNPKRKATGATRMGKRELELTKVQKRTVNLPREMREVGARIAVVDGPFQCGKTYALAHAFVGMIASYPDSSAHFAVAAHNLGFVRDTLFDNLRQACENGGLSFEYPGGNRRYGKVAGRRVYGFEGENARSAFKVRGITVAGVWIDEVTKCNDVFVEELINRASEDDALIFLSTNPEGPQHWLKSDYIDDLESKDAIRVQYKLKDRPNLKPSYIRQLDTTLMGHRRARLRYGEWAAATGSIYPNFSPRESPDELPEKYHLAIDAGYATVTHGLLIGAYADGRMWVVAEYRYEAEKGKPMSPRWIVEDMYKETARFSISRVIVDDSAADMKAEVAWVYGIEPEVNLSRDAKDVVAGINYTRHLLESEELNVHPRCTETIREMHNYQWKGNGKDEPLKENDHSCDALRYYAVRTLDDDEVIAYF